MYGASYIGRDLLNADTGAGFGGIGPHPANAEALESGNQTMRSVPNYPSEAYSTQMGTAYLGDSLELLSQLEQGEIQLILTSPPFALNRKKSYGNPPADQYTEWFLDYANEFFRALPDNGSLVVELGGAWVSGKPTRSTYHYELLLTLTKEIGFHLAQEFYWHNPAKLPTPAQWVTIERIRVKDSVTPIWWLSKTERPKADNRRVLRDYSERMKQILVNGYNRGRRPSGHDIGEGFTKDNGGSIPPNLIEASNTRSVDPYREFCRERHYPLHPARFAREVPDFFVRLLTEPKDTVLDPFSGSNMTGSVCEDLGRKWISCDSDPQFVYGSMGRFKSDDVTGR